MLKMLGLGLVSICVAMFGFLLCEKMKYRKRYLEKFIRFSAACSHDMRCNNLNIFQLFNKYGESDLEFLKKISPQSIMSRKDILHLLHTVKIDERDVFSISDFLMQLGSSDIRGQIEHCELFQLKFNELFKDAKSELNEKGKLLKSLFMFFGLGLFIIFI